MHKQDHIDRITSIRHELVKAHEEGRPTHGWHGKLRDAYVAGKEHHEVRQAFREAREAIGVQFSGDCAPPGEPHVH